MAPDLRSATTRALNVSPAAPFAVTADRAFTGNSASRTRMICARRCARRGLGHGRGVNSQQFDPTDPGAARAAAEVFQLDAEAPDVGDGFTEWSQVAPVEEDNVWLLGEAACRLVRRKNLSRDQLCMRVGNRTLCLRLLDGPRSDVTWPDEIDLDLLSGPEIVLIPPAGLSPAAAEVDALLRTRFFWPDQEDLLVAARVAAEESAGQLQASGRLRHPGRSEDQTQVPYNQEVNPSASALDDHDKERERSRCAPSKTAPAPSPT
jgi:hypothetical protein